MHGHAQARRPQRRPPPQGGRPDPGAARQRSGFSQQYISKLEQGRRNPTVVTLYEIAQGLGVSHVELVRED